MDSHADSIESTLTGGADGSVSTDGQNLIAYRKFENSAETEVDFIIGQAVSAVQGIALSGIADLRKDCVVCLSPPIEASLNTDPTDAVLTWGNTINPSTYAILDSTALKVYDKYNDVFVNIGASAAVAGCMAATDDVADPWFSPAGVSRGQIRGVTKLLWNPSQANRDMLYKAGINPIVSMPGQGTMLFGDKTHAGAPSSFDRINVRRLFITLQKAINLAARAQLFEFNDEFTRAQFKNMIEPFLRDVKGRRGVTDFKVVCDGTNNTGTIVDTNQFIADIYVKPSRSINFITLNFIVTRTGVAFSEIAG
jgi:phage tail sheath protein FI